MTEKYNPSKTYYSAVTGFHYNTEEQRRQFEQKAILDAQRKQNLLLEEQNKLLRQQSVENNNNQYVETNPDIIKIKGKRTIYTTICIISFWITFVTFILGVISLIQPSVITLILAGICLISFSTLLSNLELDTQYKRKLIDEYYNKKFEESANKVKQQKQEQQAKINKETLDNIRKQYEELKLTYSSSQSK